GPRMLHLLFVFLAPIAPKSGAAMCALAPADFQAVGVQNASKPNANVQEGGASAYCVYAGKSSATGGIELDVFYPAGTNAKEAQATCETAIGESGGSMKPIKIAGADEARWSDKVVSGGPPAASITVRKGTLVFVLGFPTSKNAQTQLTKLAELLLKKF